MSQLEDAIRESMARAGDLALYDEYRLRERVADAAISEIEGRDAPQDDATYAAEMAELRELRRSRRYARNRANALFDVHAGIVAREMIAGGLL